MKVVRTIIKRHRASVLPGQGLTLGFTVLYTCLLVALPLAALILKSAHLSPHVFWRDVSEPQVVASYRLSFSASAIAALVNGIFGLLVAWVLTRYRFPLRSFIDGLVDLPFALPTAVAGITLTTLYDKTGWIGSLFAQGGLIARHLFPQGLQITYRPLGIVIALVFVGLPFVVRTVQPVIEDLDVQLEEAAASLGASRFQTFVRVILPALLPALITGVTLAFARAIGEYGSVVFIAGNIPYKTQIIPVRIMAKLEEFDVPGATAIAVVMLLASFALLLVINFLQHRLARKYGAV